jgi:hypothetical protein
MYYFLCSICTHIVQKYYCITQSTISVKRPTVSYYYCIVLYRITIVSYYIFITKQGQLRKWKRVKLCGATILTNDSPVCTVVVTVCVDKLVYAALSYKCMRP